VDHRLRRENLLERFADIQVDAILVTRLPNVRYLTGFTGSNAQLLVTEAQTVFFTDGRYTEQSRHEVEGVERVICLEGFDEALAAQCSRLGSSRAKVGSFRVGFEAHDVTVSRHERLSDALGAVELVRLGAEVEGLRRAKDQDEIAMLRRAQEVTDQAFEGILDRLAVGLAETQIAVELEVLLRREGADGLSFDPIVAFGENAAEPHHAPGRRVLEEGDVIKLDFGAACGGYHADMTRTVAFGEPAPELKKIHELVREAQQAGIDAVRAGAMARDVDHSARSVIEAAGYGDSFTHGLGHGVGLEIHEAPNLGRRFEELLPEGAVVTIEPGIYLPGLGGVRIEDMVEVTPDGCRVLGTSPRELIEL
jgi:Xaa-Pro aminopeptidase